MKRNGEQTLKLRSASVKFKDYFKQLAALFKIYVDFECIVKRVKSIDESSDRGNNVPYFNHVFLAILLIKLLTSIRNLQNQLFFTTEKMQSINLLSSPKIKSVLQKSDKKTF